MELFCCAARKELLNPKSKKWKVTFDFMHKGHVKKNEACPKYLFGSGVFCPELSIFSGCMARKPSKRLEKKAGASKWKFMFHDHFVTLLLHYFYMTHKDFPE